MFSKLIEIETYYTLEIEKIIFLPFCLVFTLENIFPIRVSDFIMIHILLYEFSALSHF
jgi:hypothetical protein